MRSPGPDDVRAACASVAAQARWLRVSEEAVARWAAAVKPDDIQPSPKPADLVFAGTLPERARWTLLLDALNFCFWTEAEPWVVTYRGRTWGRYSALLASLHRGISSDRAWLTARRWAEATREQVEQVFTGSAPIPLIEDRVRIINETGRVLLDGYAGEAINLLEQAGFSAPKIATAAARDFPSFHDVPTWRGREVPILKRAQILAADLAAAFAGEDGPPIVQLETLTAFADYRIPQILRYLGVLTLDAGLESRIESRQRLGAGSEEEVELRACTVHAVERMCSVLRERTGVDKTAWILDEYLWDQSHRPEVRNEHHRTFTFYY